MTLQRTVIITLGLVITSVFSFPAQALDGATLYIERTCIACHGDEGRVPAMTEYPKIAGQTAPYLVAQMKDIKSGIRSNSHSVAMKNVMHMISDEEMDIVAKWLSTLPD